jgi:hypothetical protein
MSWVGNGVVRFVVALAAGAAVCGQVSALPAVYAVSGAIDSAATANPAVRTLAGNVSPFGEVDGTLTFTSINLQTGTFTAAFKMAVAGRPKDSVTGTVAGQFLNPFGTQYVEVITITGGTGRYKGSSGVILLTGVVDPTTGLGRDTIVGGVVFVP